MSKYKKAIDECMRRNSFTTAGFFALCQDMGIDTTLRKCGVYLATELKKRGIRKIRKQGRESVYSAKGTPVSTALKAFEKNGVPAINTEPRPKRGAPPEPELNYTQIGKGIMDYMTSLEARYMEDSGLTATIGVLQKEVHDLKEKLQEKNVHIRNLNVKITALNKLRVPAQNQGIDTTKTFPLKDIVRMRK